MKLNQTIQIHGSFQQPDNIIFGYGDDSHPFYEKLELTGNDEYLLNIKPHYYPFSKDYVNLINFIEKEVFDVFVLGHSLGLSDRVLLKTILENKNCKCVRIFHRNNRANQLRKYMALSRHFTDKSKVRRITYDYDKRDILN